MIETQLECVRMIVNAHIERGLPKGQLIKQFHDLYDEELIHEDTFLRWEADIHDQTPQRQGALEDVRFKLQQNGPLKNTSLRWSVFWFG